MDPFEEDELSPLRRHKIWAEQQAELFERLAVWMWQEPHGIIVHGLWLEHFPGAGDLYYRNTLTVVYEHEGGE